MHVMWNKKIKEEGRGSSSGGGGCRLPHKAAAEDERAAKVNERRPTFVGVSVLIAITFVLIRSPQSGVVYW